MVDQAALTLDVTQCPSWAGALGYGGVAAAVCLSNWGSAVRLALLLLLLLVLFVCLQYHVLNKQALLRHYIVLLN